MQKLRKYLQLFFVALFPLNVLAAWNGGAAGPLVQLDKNVAYGSQETWNTVRGFVGKSKGKACFEVDYAASDHQSSLVIGIVDESASLSTFPGNSGSAAGIQVIASKADQPFVSGLSLSNKFITKKRGTKGDIVTVCVDFSTGYAWWAHNGVWSGSPPNGLAPNVTGLSGTYYPALGTFNIANSGRLRTTEVRHLPEGFSDWGNLPDVSPPEWRRMGNSILRHGAVIQPIDVRTFMRVTGNKSAETVRSELIDFVWRAGQKNHAVSVSTESIGLVGAVSEQKWSISMPHGVVSHAFFIETKESNCLFIWHAGHEQHLITEDYSVRYLAERMITAGCDILLMSMPLHGVNRQPDIGLHDDLSQFDGPSFSAMSFFIEPVRAFVNEAIKRRSYKDIAMGGLSGGGWTTAVAGAIDTRIGYLYPLGGSMPLILDMDPSLVDGLNISSQRGDYEQSELSFYSLASYLDLYVLGAQGRRAVHFYMTHDECCFPAWAMHAFSNQLEQIVQKNSIGALIFREDQLARKHEISPWFIEIIARDFEKHRLN